MAQQVLKDANYKIIGYIFTETSGRQILKDSNYRIKGYYDPKTNKTQDSNYRIVGTGNILTFLLK